MQIVYGWNPAKSGLNESEEFLISGYPREIALRIG
jgi:hypothetical protein